MLSIRACNGATPQHAVACCQVRDAEDARLETILDWARVSLRGTLWWSRTQFRDPAASRLTHYPSSRQTHFRDGYFVYRFWFSRKSAAALFILFWGQNSGRQR